MMRYCLPSGATTMSAQELVAFEQRLCGLVAPVPVPSVAAIALASWLLEDLRRTILQSRRAGSPLAMGSAISRLLAGDIAPSDQLAEALARLTRGVVRAEDWDRPYTGKAEAAYVAPAAARPVILGVDMGRPEGDASYVAVLGETPPGPLFGVLKPSTACSFYEVHGLGLSFRLNEAAAQALHASLGAAIRAPGRAA